MSDHKCPGLRLQYCIDHPKWMVSSYGFGRWFAYAPHTFVSAGHFRTWREAYDFARQEATR